MIRSLLIGLAAGQRAMTPLALMAGEAGRGRLPLAVPGARLLSVPLFGLGAVALAAGEMAGDKMRSAPDRTVLSGLLARTLTAAFAGAALAAPHRRAEGAVGAVLVALVSSHLGLALRKRAMRRHGRTATGFAEDALVFALGWAAVNAGRGPR